MCVSQACPAEVQVLGGEGGQWLTGPGPKLAQPAGGKEQQQSSSQGRTGPAQEPMQTLASLDRQPGQQPGF